MSYKPLPDYSQPYQQPYQYQPPPPGTVYGYPPTVNALTCYFHQSIQANDKCASMFYIIMNKFTYHFYFKKCIKYVINLNMQKYLNN